MNKLLISPHNDDETLFASHIIKRENPEVLIFTDSVRQGKRNPQITAIRRRLETERAMKALGHEKYHFLGVPDELLNYDVAIKTLKDNYIDDFYDVVYVPLFEEGGNPDHNAISLAAQDFFLNKCIYYVTYVKDRPFPSGGIEVKLTSGEIFKKRAALSCYQSQIENDWSRPFFEHAQKLESEFISYTNNQS